MLCMLFSFQFVGPCHVGLCRVSSLLLDIILWRIRTVRGACDSIFALGDGDWGCLIIHTHIVALAAFVIFWVVWGVAYL
jgi:hypothetical protein